MTGFRNIFRLSRATLLQVGVVLLAIGAAAFGVFGQQGGSSQAAQSKLQLLPVQGNVHLIAGAGGNVVVQVGEETTLLVDTGLPEYSDPQYRSTDRQAASWFHPEHDHR